MKTLPAFLMFAALGLLVTGCAHDEGALRALDAPRQLIARTGRAHQLRGTPVGTYIDFHLLLLVLGEARRCGYLGQAYEIPR